MVYIEGFEPGEDSEGAVVLGLYVKDIIISNDGYAFTELTPEQAVRLGTYVTEAAEKAEESPT